MNEPGRKAVHFQNRKNPHPRSRPNLTEESNCTGTLKGFESMDTMLAPYEAAKVNPIR